MATHDYVLANASGAAFRTDLNNALAAIVSNNSNSSEPATKYAYQWWADTSASIFKIRNSSNDGWINLFTLAGGVDVDAASNFNEDVTFTTNNGNNIVFDKSDNRFLFNDSTNATFGTGADLKIFHDGTDSFIDNATGGLKLLGDTIRLKSKSVDENMVVASVNGAAELYFDNSKKLETTTEGVLIGNGGLHLGDNNKIELGNADDLQIYHDGTDSYLLNQIGNLNFYINSAEIGARIIPNGAVELYHDNVKSLETISEGCTIQKDGSNVNAILFIKSTNGGQAKLQLEAGGNQGGGVSRAARIDFVNTEVSTSSLWTIINDYQQNGTNDLSIRHGAEESITANMDSSVELFFDNSKKLETYSNGVNIPTSAGSGDLSLNVGSNAMSLILDRNARITSGIRGSDGTSNIGGSSGGGSRITLNKNLINFFTYPYVSNVGDAVTYTERFRVTSAGATVYGSLTESSDIALKENFRPITNTLEKLKEITGYIYNFKRVRGDIEHDSMGVVAQDVEKVFPEIVAGKEGQKTLQYSGLIGVLIEAVKELTDKVAALESAK